MLIETHSHTVYSKQMKIKWEGLNTPEEMVARAKEVGLGAICITDHDSIRAHKEALAAGRKHSVVVVPGIEVSSADGHILGLGINEIIPKNLSAEETIDMIHDQGGFAIAAHPFDIKGMGIQDKIKFADGIEVFNSLNLDKVANWVNKRKSEKLEKPLFAGSDAHTVDMIGMSRNSISDDVQTFDDVLHEFMKGNVEIENAEYQQIPVLIDWFRGRMSRSYTDIIDYVNVHYTVPKAQISKFMLNKFLYSRNKALEHLWSGMTNFAIKMAFVYGSFKMLI
ncbi:MAG: PHP domain-containing protein [Candidatus Micrarchaeota archaeon]|nr:PHP domain-containing protein [Candidatus Micrarchaeota archaeon]